MVKLLLDGKKSNGLYVDLITKRHKKILLFGDNNWKSKHGGKNYGNVLKTDNQNILASIR